MGSGLRAQQAQISKHTDTRPSRLSSVSSSCRDGQRTRAPSAGSGAGVRHPGSNPNGTLATCVTSGQRLNLRLSCQQPQPNAHVKHLAQYLTLNKGLMNYHNDYFQDYF